jgi:hypothetical protein
MAIFDTIGGDLRKEHTLDLNGGDWCWMGECSTFYQKAINGKSITFDTGDLIVVLYDVPVTEEAIESRVWYGAAATSTTIR